MTEKFATLTFDQQIKTVCQALESDDEEAINQCIEPFIALHEPSSKQTEERVNQSNTLRQSPLLDLVLDKLESREPHIFLQYLRLLALVSENEEEIYAANAVTKALRVMQDNETDGTVQVSGFKFLANLTQNPVVRETIAQETPALDHAGLILEDEQFSENVSVLTATCLFLANSAFDSPENKELIVMKAIIPSLTQILRDHYQIPSLALSTVHVIKNMATNSSPDTLDDLVQNGAIHLVSKVIGANSENEKIVEAGLRTLSVFLHSNDKYKRTITVMEIESILKGATSNLKNNTVTILAVVVLLLISKLKLIRHVIGDEGGMDYCFKVFEHHADDLEVARLGIKLLERLSASDSNFQRIHVDDIPIFLRVLTHNPKDDIISQYTAKMIVRLAELSDIRNAIMSRNGIGLLATSTMSHASTTTRRWATMAMNALFSSNGSRDDDDRERDELDDLMEDLDNGQSEDHHDVRSGSSDERSDDSNEDNEPFPHFNTNSDDNSDSTESDENSDDEEITPPENDQESDEENGDQKNGSHHANGSKGQGGYDLPSVEPLFFNEEEVSFDKAQELLDQASERVANHRDSRASELSKLKTDDPTAWKEQMEIDTLDEQLRQIHVTIVNRLRLLHELEHNQATRLRQTKLRAMELARFQQQHYKDKTSVQSKLTNGSSSISSDIISKFIAKEIEQQRLEIVLLQAQEKELREAASTSRKQIQSLREEDVRLGNNTNGQGQPTELKEFDVEVSNLYERGRCQVDVMWQGLSTMTDHIRTQVECRNLEKQIEFEVTKEELKKRKLADDKSLDEQERRDWAVMSREMALDRLTDEQKMVEKMTELDDQYLKILRQQGQWMEQELYRRKAENEVRLNRYKQATSQERSEREIQISHRRESLIDMIESAHMCSAQLHLMYQIDELRLHFEHEFIVSELQRLRLCQEKQRYFQSCKEKNSHQFLSYLMAAEQQDAHALVFYLRNELFLQYHFNALWLQLQYTHEDCLGLIQKRYQKQVNELQLQDHEEINEDLQSQLLNIKDWTQLEVLSELLNAKIQQESLKESVELWKFHLETQTQREASFRPSHTEEFAVVQQELQQAVELIKLYTEEMEHQVRQSVLVVLFLRKGTVRYSKSEEDHMDDEDIDFDASSERIERISDLESQLQQSQTRGWNDYATAAKENGKELSELANSVFKCKQDRDEKQLSTVQRERQEALEKMVEHVTLIKQLRKREREKLTRSRQSEIDKLEEVRRQRQEKFRGSHEKGVPTSLAGLFAKASPQSPVKEKPQSKYEPQQLPADSGNLSNQKPKFIRKHVRSGGRQSYYRKNDEG